MRVIYILVLLAFTSCIGGNSQPVLQTKIMDTPPQIYSSAAVKGFLLQLEKSDDGKCVLSYKKESEKDGKAERLIFDMEAPCQFVRHRNNNISSYDYGKEGERRTVVIVVGGKPDPEARDSLMPDGCGTSFVAVSVFADKIKTSDTVNEGGPICPSKGLDEKYFGIYSKP